MSTIEAKRRKDHCIECKLFKPIKSKDMCQNCWHKYKSRNSPHFFLRQKFSQIKQRCNNPKNKTYKRYKNRLKIDIDCFYNKFINDKNFIKLYKEWQDSNYEYSKCPSIDRINNKKSYTLNNIQFITHVENSKKDQIKTLIDVYDRDFNFIGRFGSQCDASRELKVPQGNIWKVLNGIRNHAGGYIFKYA